MNVAAKKIVSVCKSAMSNKCQRFEVTDLKLKTQKASEWQVHSLLEIAEYIFSR